jgi:hypothetical protein
MPARQRGQSRPPDLTNCFDRISAVQEQTDNPFGLASLAWTTHAESRSITTRRSAAFDASKS